MAAILITFPVGMMDTAIPWALKNYIDAITSGEKSLISSCMPFFILGFAIIQSSFSYLSTYLNAWVGAKISNGLKYDLFKKLMHCDPSFFDVNVSGTVHTRFNIDVDTACSGLLNHMKMFFTRFFTSLALIVALFMISWRLAIVAIVVLMIAVYPLTTIRRRISELVRQMVFTGSTISTHYMEAFAGNRIVTSYNLYDKQAKKISDTLDFVFRLTIKMVQRTGILSPAMHFVVGAGIAIIIGVGGYLVENSLLTAGGFVAFTTSVILLYQPIKSMGNDFNAVHLSLMAMERVFSLLKNTPKILNQPDAVLLTSIKNKIEYRNVSFEYEKDRPILKNITFTMKFGQTIALVGNSGGGKTTFVNLLPRFYDVVSGQILIDGIDIRNIDLDSLRDKIAVVFQDNFLFNGTIRENILMGKSDATPEEINSAVKSACMEEFVSELSEGLDTKVGERGALLSGGQKQRVAIARAFIKNAPVVILDEATSALDTKSEAIVQRAINNLMKDRTVIIIAHRLSTVQNADRIVVINNGEIVEVGTHNELVQKNGAYASLYAVFKV
ncbi:MAG: ABC transporter ATP-binding protein/permease [Holosporaceae bacterium]|nr:ABC transporter ATP-binding protein/permease [Holosporaceae bacterium]